MRLACPHLTTNSLFTQPFAMSQWGPGVIFSRIFVQSSQHINKATVKEVQSKNRSFVTEVTVLSFYRVCDESQ